MNTIVNITGITLRCLGTSDENAIKKAKKKEYQKKWDKKYRDNNKEKLRISKNIYVKNNKDKKKKWDKKYRDNNKEKISLQRKIYRQKNKQILANYVKSRYQKESNFKLKMVLRHRIYMALKGKVKSKTTKDLLGCTIEELWIHLKKSFKPGMTKENYGKWHVDHIRPCSSFDLTKPEEQAKCFHYTNLQTLWAHENLSKGAKIL